MRVLRGTVSSGSNNASSNLKHLEKLIAERMGLPKLVQGSLNVQLTSHYPIGIPNAKITDQEYNGREWIKLKRCRVRGLRGVIIRPKDHKDPQNSRLWFRVEIMSAHYFRTRLALEDGDELEIEVEGDENWWRAPEEDESRATDLARDPTGR